MCFNRNEQSKHSVILRKDDCTGKPEALAQVQPLPLTSYVTLNKTHKFLSISFLISSRECIHSVNKHLLSPYYVTRTMSCQ